MTNLRLLQWFVPLYGCHFWAPVWFLFFQQHFTLAQVLALEAIYFVTVVALEVPSGYLSDRVGRVPTLRLSAALSLASVTLYAFGPPSFPVFAAAGMLWAASFACNSGTDTAFHYDILQSLGRAGEFTARHARLLRNAFIARSLGAIGGGLIAVIGLKYAYYASIPIAICFTALAVSFRPTRHAAAPAILPQLKDCLRHLRQPYLAWMFAFAVCTLTLVHIPYEFSQPYLARTLGEETGKMINTPWLSGLMIASIAVIGAITANYAALIKARLGIYGSLMATTVLQVILIAGMALLTHPAVLPLLLLRSVQSAMGDFMISTEVIPRLSQHQRATYLSLQSFAGRGLFAVILGGLGLYASIVADQLSGGLMAALILSLLMLLGLAVSFPRQ